MDAMSEWLNYDNNRIQQIEKTAVKNPVPNMSNTHSTTSQNIVTHNTYPCSVIQ